MRNSTLKSSWMTLLIVLHGMRILPNSKFGTLGPKIVNHVTAEDMFTLEITIMCGETRIAIGEGDMFFCFSFNLYRQLGPQIVAQKLYNEIPKLFYSYPPALLFSKQMIYLFFS